MWEDREREKESAGRVVTPASFIDTDREHHLTQGRWWRGKPATLSKKTESQERAHSFLAFAFVATHPFSRDGDCHHAEN